MFKMDTGSTISTISKEELRKLGYDDRWIKENARKDELPPSTADRKKVSAYYVQLPILNLIGFEAKEWPLYILLDDYPVNHFTEECKHCKRWDNLNAHCGKCSHNELMQIDFRNLMGARFINRI